MTKKLLTLLALLIGAASNAQTLGDVLTWKKGPGLGDAKLYTTPVNSSLYALNGSGTFTLLAQSNFVSTATIGGYGFVVGPASATDGTLARWDGTTGKLLKEGLATSQGGNEASDGGKVAIYSSTGQLMAGVSGGSALRGISTNDEGVHGTSGSGTAIYGNVTGAGAIGLRLTHAGASGEFIRCWQSGEASNQFVVDRDGAISWPNGGTGPQTTATNLPAFGSATKGVVPASGGGTANFLRADGSWAAPAGGGDFVGPASSTDNAILRFDGTTGKLGQNSGITIADGASGTLSGTNTGDQTSVTGNAGTATALATGRTIAITGDLSYTSPSFDGSGNVTAAGTLATVNSNVGSFGSATEAPAITVNAKGQITAASTNTITPAVGSITGLGTGVATALAVNTGSAGSVVVNGGALGTPSGGTLTNATGLPLTTGVTGTLPIANGGTNATTEATARTNLGVVQQQYASVGSGFTTTSATLANITSCGLTIAASSAVSFTGEVLFEVSSTSGGIGLGINGSTAATYVAGRYEATQSAGNVAISNITAYATTTNAATVAAANTVYYGRITGRIVNGGSSSDISVQVARGGSAGTLTIRSCSLLITGTQ